MSTTYASSLLRLTDDDVPRADADAADADAADAAAADDKHLTLQAADNDNDDDNDGGGDDRREATEKNARGGRT